MRRRGPHGPWARDLLPAALILALAVLTGCQEAPKPPGIRLTAESPESPRPSTEPILARELDRPVEFLQRPTYSEINDLVRNGHADVAFVCDYAFILGRTGGMRIVVDVSMSLGQSVFMGTTPASTTGWGGGPAARARPVPRCWSHRRRRLGALTNRLLD